MQIYSEVSERVWPCFTQDCAHRTGARSWSVASSRARASSNQRNKDNVEHLCAHARPGNAPTRPRTRPRASRARSPPAPRPPRPASSGRAPRSARSPMRRRHRPPAARPGAGCGTPFCLARGAGSCAAARARRSGGPYAAAAGAGARPPAALACLSLSGRSAGASLPRCWERRQSATLALAGVQGLLIMAAGHAAWLFRRIRFPFGGSVMSALIRAGAQPLNFCA